MKGKGGGVKGEEEVEIGTVLFVPATPGGELALRLQRGDDKYREGTKFKKVKMVEKGGMSLKELLKGKDPERGGESAYWKKTNFLRT